VAPLKIAKQSKNKSLIEAPYLNKAKGKDF
jgi:hypothetical protein